MKPLSRPSMRIEPLESRIAPAFVSGSFNLSGLNGSNGGSFAGAAGDAAGSAVSAAGDVNGDGLGDFIVGLPGSNGTAGGARVILGSFQPFPATASLDSLPGFDLVGIAAGDRAGTTVGAAGDVNGDGLDDILIGAPDRLAGSGETYLILGRLSFPDELPLPASSTKTEIRFEGFPSGRSGASLAGVGDLNHDGFDDVVIGLPGPTGASVSVGGVQVVYGSASAQDLANGIQQFALIVGEAGSDRFGFSVAGAGDVNGDGFDDIIVGAYGVESERGAAYLVYGQAARLPVNGSIGTMLGTQAIKLRGAEAGERAGFSVSGAGDVNGDGLADVLVGAFRNVSERGAAYVVFGTTGVVTSPVELGALSGSKGFAVFGPAVGEHAGQAVSSAGDVNGDGFDDLLIGAPLLTPAAETTGGAYVVFGRANIAASPPDLSSLSITTGFIINGVADLDSAGSAVQSAGDVNGDGYADLLIGAPGAGAGAGKAHLVLGAPSGAFIDPTIAANGKSATYTDVDGDAVTVKVTKGTLTPANFKLLAKDGAGPRAQLLELNLPKAFDGTNLTVTAVRASGGDGRVNVGFLTTVDSVSSESADLGNVTISGDLGSLAVGDDKRDLGLKSLTVGSLGLLGGLTGDGRGQPLSVVAGGIGPVKIAGDFREGLLLVERAGTAANDKIASLTIGGSLGSAETFASVLGLARIGPVKIGGDLYGLLNAGNGFTGGGIGSITIGGSVLGRIGGGTLGNITIGGSVIGGDSPELGKILAAKVGRVTIAGDLLGGSAPTSGSIESGKGIAAVTIGGDLRGGTTPGQEGMNGIITSGGLGPVVIRGDVIGSETSPVAIVGDRTAGPGIRGIASVTITGDFERGFILAGISNGGARIGAVRVGGDWVASSLSSGIVDEGGIFGNGDDFVLPAFPGGVASVGSVTIKGEARGTFEDGDRFAIVAQQIGSVSIGGAKLPLTKSKTRDPANNLAAIPVGPTPDFVVREVSRTAAAPAEVFTATPAAGPLSAIPAALDLATLVDGDGFRVSGAAPGDFAGQDVSGAGDVNGDGFDDFIVSAYRAHETGSRRGAIYVVFGQAGSRPSFNLSTLNGVNGFKLVGVANNDYAGDSVTGAIDVNGDGFDDLLIGADRAGADDRGAAYVIFGRSSFSAVPVAGFSIGLGTLDGANGFKLTGAEANEQAGKSVSGAGDVNGDGLDDFIVGATGVFGTPGVAYVVFGQRSFAGASTPGFSIGLETLDGENGFKLTGEDAGDRAGRAVSGAGDVNGDGLDDLIVGAAEAEEPGGTNRGAAYVIFGRTSFIVTPAPGFALGLGTLDGDTGFKLTGVDDQAGIGASVGAAGDVNGDGLADVIVGAPLANENGEAYVIFGRRTFTETLAEGFAIGVGTLDGATGFRVGGVQIIDQAGNSVSGAGDVNGDGFADLIVGAYSADVGSENSNRGAAYVVFGKSRFTGTPAAGFGFNLGSLDGANGFRISGAAVSDSTGRSVSAAGDVNGDGFGDVIVGADLVDADGSANNGAAYVVYGGPSGEFIQPTISTDGTTATWTDVDGDLVTLKVSNTTTPLMFSGDSSFALLAKSSTDNRAQLLALNFGSAFDGADISLTAKRAGGGDGKVNLGHLNAFLTDLGKVTIGGDLGRITVGDTNVDAPFASLTVGSLGAFGGRTENTGGSLVSRVSGPAGALNITGDLREAFFVVTPVASAPNGTLASVTIGGALIGGKANATGAIAAKDSLGAVKIGGDVVGGAGVFTGYLESKAIASLTIGGSLLGGAGVLSGTVLAGVAAFSTTGLIDLNGALGDVTIGGDQRGGAGLISGALYAGTGIGNISIGRDQIGGAGAASGLIFTNFPGANITSVTIGGDARGGDAVFSGGIVAGGTLGPVIIKGDVLGTAGFAYTLRGSGPLTGATSVALTSLSVTGDFERALILAGYAADNVPANGRAQIGAISVGGDWIASSATAGLLTRSAAPNANGVFGNGDDRFIPLPTSGLSGVVASIASLTIKGRAVGSLATGDHFGIVAEQIGAVTIGGVSLEVSVIPRYLGPTPDFVIREVDRP